MPQVSVITLCSNNKMRFQKSCTLCSHHVIHDAELMETDTSGKQSLPDKVKRYQLQTHSAKSLNIRFFPPWTPTLVSFGCWLPVFSTNYWQTNLTLFIDVRVIDLRFKCNLRRFEWIFCWEVDFDSEGSFVIWRIVLQQGNKNQECSIF